MISATFILWISRFLVAAGAACIIQSLHAAFRFSRTSGHMVNRHRKNGLMVLFLLGYTAVLAASLLRPETSPDLMVAIIFAAGGLFVRDSVLGEISAINSLREMSSELEIRVEHRTRELDWASQDAQNTRQILQSFFNTSSNLMGIVELLEDDILHVTENPASAAFGGRPRGARNQSVRASGATSEIIDFWSANYRRSRETGQPVHFEYESEHPSRRSLLAVVNFIGVSAQGRDQYSYCVVDITEQKNMQDSLRRSERRQKELMQLVPVGVYLTDVHGKCRLVNRAWQQIAGMTEDEALGDGWTRSLSLEDTTLVMTAWQAAVTSHQPFECEFRMRRPNGEERCVISRALPLKDSAGATVEYLGSLQDITEQRIAEKERWEATEQTRLILQSTHYAVIATDNDGIIRTFNPTAEKLLGYSAEEAVGKLTPLAFHDLAEIADRHRQISARLGLELPQGPDFLKMIARGEISDHGEWTYIRKDGSRVSVHISLSEITGANGSKLGFVGMVEDITEDKMMREELLEANRRAMAATRAKSEFLANMSHEIRTPMNGVIGMCNLLLDSAKDDEQTKKLKIIQSCGNSLLDLLNDILDFSKIEAGKLELENEPFNPQDTVREVLTLLEGVAANNSHLSLVYQPEAGVPSWVLGDPGRFRQVLMNLVSNAIKFTSRGSVTIRSAGRSFADGSVELKFTVSDTGIGIPREAQSRLFQSFQQVDASTTRRFGGSGLGLAICKGLVEKMGGEIAVQSEAGVGTVFTFTMLTRESLPTARPAANNENAEANSEFALQHPHQILVAEDNRTNQLVIGGMLQRLGYRPDIAGDGQEVLECLRRKQYSLILMDCHMPVLDGFEATRAIRSQLEIHQPCIIAVTASTMKEDVERCLSVGMNSVIAKPIEMAALLEVLGRKTSTVVSDKDVA